MTQGVTIDVISSGAATTGKLLTADGVGGVSYSGQKESVGVAMSDETTALAIGTALTTIRIPFAMTLTEVRANVNTAPTGATIIVDIKKNGVSVLSTLLSIDAAEKTSVTALTPAVISVSTLADDDEMTFDITQVGSTIAGTGLKVWLIGTRT